MGTQTMKAANVKLQLELEGVMKRLAEVEVSKDTKGTFMFGGGRVSNAALRLGVRRVAWRVWAHVLAVPIHGPPTVRSRR